MPRAAGRIVIVAAALAAVIACLPAAASASHFRAGNLNWSQFGPTVGGSTPATFQNQQSYRRSAFAGSPSVGDIIPGTADSGLCITWGDGSALECPSYLVTFANAAEDYIIMQALAPGSTTNRNVPHSFLGPGPFTTSTSSCCTISTLNNAADASWSVSSLVDLTTDDESPQSTVPPIVQLPEGGVQSYTVPAVDTGGETLRFRLTTPQESCGGCLAAHPPGLTIDAGTGQVSWDTTGRGPTQANASGLWWTGVVVEAVLGGRVVSSSQIDYIIRVGGAGANQSPTWDDTVTPADGTVLTARPGERVTFGLRARDPDAEDTVQILQNSGPGTLTPSPGNPASAAFAYTVQPGDVGRDQIVQFLAQDDGSPPLGPPFRSFIIRGSTSPPADTTPPQTTITSGPTGTTSDNTPTFAFTSNEVGSTFQCRVDSGAFAACTSPHTRGPLADGTHTFSVRATDRAGNTDPTPATRSFTVNVPPSPAPPAPPAPFATSGSPAPPLTTPLVEAVEGESEPDADADGIPDASDTSDAFGSPTLGRTALASLVSGVVFVRRPGGAARAAQVTGPSPPKGFVALKGAERVPVGSVLDTRRGRVELESAGPLTATGRRSSVRSDFFDGIFQVKQRRRASRGPVTDILVRSSSLARKCGSGASGATARSAGRRRSKRVVSRLWGNGKGRFRTRGRHSAGTVRGTIWLTEERCDGTRTFVHKGSVTVRDLRARRTVVVRAGQSYLARAQRATIKTRRRR